MTSLAERIRYAVTPEDRARLAAEVARMERALDEIVAAGQEIADAIDDGRVIALHRTHRSHPCRTV